MAEQPNKKSKTASQEAVDLQELQASLAELTEAHDREMQQHEQQFQEDLLSMGLLLATVCSAATVAISTIQDSDSDEEHESDNVLVPREHRRYFDSNWAIVSINNNYLGPLPLFNGREFKNVF